MAVHRMPDFFPQRIGMRVPNMQAADHSMLFGGLGFYRLGAPAAADTDGLVDGVLMVNGSAVEVTSFLADEVPGKYGRTLSFVASNTNTRVVTIDAFDYKNMPFRETVTLAGATPVYTKRAVKRLKKLTFASASDTTTVDVGWANGLGLPYKLNAPMATFIDGALSANVMEKLYLSVAIPQTELLAPTTMYVTSPVRGYVTGLRSVVQTAINTGGPITVTIGGVAVTGLSVTHGADAAGVVQVDTIAYGVPTSLVEAGGAIAILPDASFATAGAVRAELEVTPAELITGDETTPSATTRDVRGLYYPALAPDGVRDFAVMGWFDTDQMDGLAQYSG